MGAIAGAGYWGGGKRRTLRTHRNAGLEIVCVTGGSAAWHIEGRAYRVTPGSVFFTWPWEWHGSVRDTEPGLELWYAAIRLDRPGRRKPADFAWHADLNMPPRVARSIRRTLLASDQRTAKLSERMLWLVRQLVAAPASASAAHLDRAYTGALGTAALIELARSVSGQDPAAPRAADGVGAQRAARLIERLAEGCHEPWSVERMAITCRLSRSRFTQLVRAQTGDSPLLLLNRLRIERAQRLLRTTDQSVIDIALSCGFHSSQYFCRVFRDYAGRTPTQYRKASG